MYVIVGACHPMVRSTIFKSFWDCTTNRFGAESNNDDFDEEASDKSFVKRHFPRWDPRDKIKHGGGKMSSSIVTHRLAELVYYSDEYFFTLLRRSCAPTERFPHIIGVSKSP